MSINDCRFYDQNDSFAGRGHRESYIKRGSLQLIVCLTLPHHLCCVHQFVKAGWRERHWGNSCVSSMYTVQTYTPPPQCTVLYDDITRVLFDSRSHFLYVNNIHCHKLGTARFAKNMSRMVPAWEGGDGSKRVKYDRYHLDTADNSYGGPIRNPPKLSKIVHGTFTFRTWKRTIKI